jgi:large subunit ribosomal protein L13
MKIIDGENCVLGRLCTAAAKKALEGEEIRIINAEKIVILGNPVSIVNGYRYRFYLRDPAKPEKSPNYPKRPDLFVKRAIRGMLPFKRTRGKDAYRRVRAFIGAPRDLKGKTEKFGELKDMYKKRMTVEQLCRKVGWTG